MAKKQNKETKPKTIKGAILEIILSILAICAIFALTIFFYESYKKQSYRFQEAFTYMLFMFGLAFIFLLDGIISIPVIIKKRKTEKSQKLQENTEKLPENNKIIDKNNKKDENN